MEQIQTKTKYYNTIRDEFEGNEVLFDLPIRVYYWYRNHVKNNKNIIYEQVKRKLSRNIYLAKESIYKNDENDRRRYFFYGNLLITLNKKLDDTYEIGYVNNSKGCFNFYIDWDYRDYLNDKFEIIDDKENYDLKYAIDEMIYTIENQSV